MRSAEFRVRSRGQGPGARGQGSASGNTTHHSPLTTHHSPIRRGRGVTLLEVLFSIVVASVGLLGAIAVFPVAMSQVRKGQVADMTAAAADAAVHSFDAQHMRRPARWLNFFDDPANNNNDGPAFFAAAYNANNPRAFTYPATATYPQGTPFGAAYCIDPRFFEQNRLAYPNDGSLWSYFPAVPDGTSFNSGAASANATTWGRMLRVTLHRGNPLAPLAALPMSLIQADQVFRIEDQLIYERPADNSLVAVQLFTQMATNSGNVAARRQEEGRITWMATLVPKIDQPHLTSADVGSLAHKGPTTATGVNYFVTNSYKLSIVVFYDRSPDLIVPDLSQTPPNRPWTEWTAKILGGAQANDPGGFIGSGIGGGEVRISSLIDAPNAEYREFAKAEALDLKRGSWIALSRTVPVGNKTGLLFGPNNPPTQVPAAPPYFYLQYLQWYRVSDSDETQFDSNTNRWYRDVTLVGPDWPADVLDNNTGDPGSDDIPEECDVIIVTGVNHVYERTIGLDRESIAQ